MVERRKTRFVKGVQVLENLIQAGDFTLADLGTAGHGRKEKAVKTVLTVYVIEREFMFGLLISIVCLLVVALLLGGSLLEA